MRDTRDMHRAGLVLSALYAWSTALAVGVVVADMVIAAQPGVADPAGSEVVDLLLLFTAAVLILGVAASGATAGHPAASRPLVASLVVLVVGLFTPLWFGGVAAALEAALGIAIGPALRLVEASLVSALAFIGFWGSVRSAGPGRGPVAHG
jgi:hypothetical protein